jgi:hypothetical protein
MIVNDEGEQEVGGNAVFLDLAVLNVTHSGPGVVRSVKDCRGLSLLSSRNTSATTEPLRLAVPLLTSQCATQETKDKMSACNLRHCPGISLEILRRNSRILAVPVSKS